MMMPSKKFLIPITVDVDSTSQYYYSIKAQIGLRRFTKRSSKRKANKTADEFGVSFRYSLQNLGTATFTGDEYQTTISPIGHIAGFYYKILLTSGNQKVKRKVRKVNEKKELLPPIIYNHRY